MLTQEELERFTEVMLEKARRAGIGYTDDPQRELIQMVIADTALLIEGVVLLEAWEAAAK